MSMNFSDFKKLLGADPFNRDPETLDARDSSAEFEAAARLAEAFEEKLRSAMQVSPPADLLEKITTISTRPAKHRNWIPLALAASLLVAIGAAGIVWKQSPTWDSVEAYVADHYSHDGNRVLARASGSVPEQDINAIMAGFNASADERLSAQIRFIKICPTPHGRGVHMVVSTSGGPVTVLFMPETSVTDGEMVNFEQMHALLVNLEHGSAAIIGKQSQAVDNLVAMLRESLKTGLLGA